MDLNTKFADLERPGVSYRQDEGSWTFHSPIGNRETENDPDIWLETGLLGFLLMVLVLLGYAVYAWMA